MVCFGGERWGAFESDKKKRKTEEEEEGEWKQIKKTTEQMYGNKKKLGIIKRS